MGWVEEKLAIREHLNSYGICICRNHGAYYLSKAGQRVCHLVSADVSEQEVGAVIRRHIYDKCYRKKRPPSETLTFETPDLGRIVKQIMVDQSSAVCGPIGDDKKGTLMYLCGCDGVQPKRRDMFKKHIKSETYRGVCPCSISGKSVEERAASEAVALALCRVRCVRASCGLWLVTSRKVPELSTLPRIIEKAVQSALKKRRGIKSKAMNLSKSGGTGAVARSDLASVDEHDQGNQEDDTSEHVPEDEPEIAGEAAEADIEGETNPADFGTNPPKPTILLFGYHHRKEENEANLSYDNLLREARSCKAELPGAIRDKARIVRVRELGFDTFSVSIGNMGENDEKHHYHGDFCTRSIVSELKAELKRCGKLSPVQVCIDCEYTHKRKLLILLSTRNILFPTICSYSFRLRTPLPFHPGFFCPSGWDTEKFLRPKFFTHTLPEIASILSTEPVPGRQGQRLSNRRRKEATIPSGVVFIPFTRRIVAELFKVRAALEKIYEISFIDREQLLIEHPMFAATASIPDEEMEAFQKRPRPEDRYAKEIFDAVQTNRMDGAATNIDGASLKDYVMGNCPESTRPRMIKLAVKR